MFVNPFLLALAALPVDEMGCHHNFLSEFFIKFTKVLYKIKYIVVITGVPNIVFDSVVWPPQVELNENGNLFTGILRSCLHEIEEL